MNVDRPADEKEIAPRSLLPFMPNETFFIVCFLPRNVL